MTLRETLTEPNFFLGSLLIVLGSIFTYTSIKHEKPELYIPAATSLVLGGLTRIRTKDEYQQQ
jgi:hypothetical protein